MDWYNFLTSTFNQFIGIFPSPIQWLITLFVLIGLITLLVALVRHHILFLLLIILLLPFLIPIIIGFFGDVVGFVVYLLGLLHLTSPS